MAVIKIVKEQFKECPTMYQYDDSIWEDILVCDSIILFFNNRVITS